MKAALRPFRKQGNITNYIRICADIGQSHTQGMAIATVLQGKTINYILSQQRDQDLWRIHGSSTGPSGSCFVCGLLEHQIRQCPHRRVIPRTRREPGLCRRYRRGKLWTSECRSKRDDLGNPPFGKRYRGQLQVPRQNFGAIQQPVLP